MDTPDMFECRLVGYSKQSRKDGDWVEIRLHIHPDDVTPALAQAPLKTAFMVAAVPVDPRSNVPAQNLPEDYVHEKPKRSWDEIPLSEQIGMRVKEPQFQKWVAQYWEMPELNSEDAAAGTNARVLAHLQVLSKKNVLCDTATGDLWESLDQEYQESFGLIAERTT